MATKVDQLVVELTAKIDGLQASLRTAQGDIQRFSGNAKRDIGGVDSAVLGVRRAFIALGGVWAAWNVGRSIVNAAVSMEALENKMKAATGSADVAADALAHMRAESERLGQNFKFSADSFASFAASALRSGLTLQETKDIFQGVSEAATAMRLSTERVQFVFMAVSQMASKGQVTMEDLKQQLGEHLPGALQIFAKSMGVTNDEFIKMVANGQVTTEHLKKLGKGLHDEFGQAAVDAAQSAQAAFNRLGNAVFELQNKMASAGFLDAVTQSVHDLTDALNDPDTAAGLAAFAEGIGLIITKAAEAIGWLSRLSEKMGQVAGQAIANGYGPDAASSLAMRMAGISQLGQGPKPADLPQALKDAIAKRGYDAPGLVLDGGLAKAGDYSGYSLGTLSNKGPSEKEIKAREKLEAKLDDLLYKLGGLGMDEIQRDAYEKEGDAAKQFEAEQKILEDALEQRLITEQEFRENMLKAETDYQEELTKIKEEAEEQRAELTQKAQDIETASRTKAVNAALGLMSMFGGKSKAMAIAALAVEKGLAIASTIAASYKSAMAARATYMALGNPVAAEAAYAREIAMGQLTAGLIAATGIAQAAMGGGSSGGGGGGAAVTDENGTVIGGPVDNSRPKQVYINIQGDDDQLFSARTVRKLMEQIGEAIGDRKLEFSVV